MGTWRDDDRPTEANGAIIESMPIATPFNAPTAKGPPKVIKIRDGTEVAARYFVYKLYDTTGGHPMQWRGPAWDGGVSSDDFQGG